MRCVVLCKRIQEVRVVSSVDIAATPEGVQIAHAVEYVVRVSTGRDDLEGVRARMGFGGVDCGRAAALGGNNDTPYTAVDGAFKVSSDDSA